MTFFHKTAGDLWGKFMPILHAFHTYPDEHKDDDPGTATAPRPHSKESKVRLKPYIDEFDAAVKKRIDVLDGLTAWLKNRIPEEERVLAIKLDELRTALLECRMKSSRYHYLSDRIEKDGDMAIEKKEESLRKATDLFQDVHNLLAKIDHQHKLLRKQEEKAER